MKINDHRENGYAETIRKGIDAVRSFRGGLSYGRGAAEENVKRLKAALREADAVVIGAGAGLSTSAGFTYSGERFDRYFYDFRDRYGITDMYSGGFYPFPDAETTWAWWARHIYFNRYVKSPKPVYEDLLSVVSDKEYFVITTNVDHRFQLAGFDKKRLFCTQGDYGLFQRRGGGDGKTYDNAEWVAEAMEAERFIKDENGYFTTPKDRLLNMRLPSRLIPKTPDGYDVSMNLRSDDTFVEDDGWRRASENYASFLHRHAGERVLFLELGVGSNTPVIIKYPFWAMAAENKNAVYACLNMNETCCPVQIFDRSVCIDGDAGEILKKLK